MKKVQRLLYKFCCLLAVVLTVPFEDLLKLRSTNQLV
jgi:hypothetical protein